MIDFESALRALVAGRFLDHPGEVAVAAATIIAVLAVVASLPPLLADKQGTAARSRLTPALVMLTGGAAITFAAYLAFQIRCSGGAGCRNGAGTGFGEFERWWRSEVTWQWGAQLLLASLGLVAASIAFWLSARASSWSRPPLWAARILYIAWAIFVFLVPAAYEIAN